MWSILSDGAPIYDPRNKSLQVGAPRLSVAENRAETATFTVYPDHPNLSDLRKLSSTVEIAYGQNVLCRGRLIDDVKTFLGFHQMTVEGALAFANDSVIRPFVFPDDFLEDAGYQDAADNGNVVEFFLGWILSQHNAQVGNDRKLLLGTVTVEDPNNYITRASEEYLKTFDVLQDKLFDSALGGRLFVRYEANGNYIDYLSDYTTQSAQDVKFARNLLDLTHEIDATQTYTVVLPLGAKGDETGKRITIEDLADGAITEDLVKDGDQIYSISGVAAYGRICAPVDETTWDDVNVALNLQTKAAQYLANTAVKLQQNIQIKAADLEPLGQALQIFLPFTRVNVISDPHDMSQAFDVCEIDYTLDSPGDTQLTLGSVTRTLTDATAAKIRSAEETVQSFSADIAGNASRINELATTLEEQTTSIIQDAQQIILTALEGYVRTGDFTSYQETVAASLAVMSDQIVMNFTTTTNQITATNDEIARIYNERLRYIRFVDGNIVLGEEGNELILTIRNDRISFTQDNLEVAYFSNQKLYVTNGEFINSLQLGVFGFVPAQDGQSLSFKKVS